MPFILALSAVSSCLLAISVSKQACKKLKKRRENEQNKKS